MAYKNKASKAIIDTPSSHTGLNTNPKQNSQNQNQNNNHHHGGRRRESSIGYLNRKFVEYQEMMAKRRQEAQLRRQEQEKNEPQELVFPLQIHKTPKKVQVVESDEDWTSFVAEHIFKEGQKMPSPPSPPSGKLFSYLEQGRQEQKEDEEEEERLLAPKLSFYLTQQAAAAKQAQSKPIASQDSKFIPAPKSLAYLEQVEQKGKKDSLPKLGSFFAHEGATAAPVDKEGRPRLLPRPVRKTTKAKPKPGSKSRKRHFVRDSDKLPPNHPSPSCTKIEHEWRRNTATTLLQNNNNNGSGSRHPLLKKEFKCSCTQYDPSLFSSNKSTQCQVHSPHHRTRRCNDKSIQAFESLYHMKPVAASIISPPRVHHEPVPGPPSLRQLPGPQSRIKPAPPRRLSKYLERKLYEEQLAEHQAEMNAKYEQFRVYHEIKKQSDMLRKWRSANKRWKKQLVALEGVKSSRDYSYDISKETYSEDVIRTTMGYGIGKYAGCVSYYCGSSPLVMQLPPTPPPPPPPTMKPRYLPAPPPPLASFKSRCRVSPPLASMKSYHRAAPSPPSMKQRYRASPPTMKPHRASPSPPLMKPHRAAPPTSMKPRKYDHDYSPFGMYSPPRLTSKKYVGPTLSSRVRATVPPAPELPKGKKRPYILPLHIRQQQQRYLAETARERARARRPAKRVPSSRPKWNFNTHYKPPKMY